jgi:cytochrome c1
MPLFEFECPGGHVTEELMAESVPDHPCACGQPGRLRLSLPARGKVVGGTDGGHDAPLRAKADAVTTVVEIAVDTRVVTVGQRGFKVYNYKCVTCGKPGMDVVRRDSEPVVPECCGVAMSPVVSVADVDWFTKAASGSLNGVYDRCAGRWFASKADRKAWMVANGMEDWNDVNNDDITRRRSERERKEDDYVESVLAGYDRDPLLLKMRDAGQIRDWEPFRPTRRP